MSYSASLSHPEKQSLLNKTICSKRKENLPIASSQIPLKASGKLALLLDLCNHFLVNGSCFNTTPDPSPCWESYQYFAIFPFVKDEQINSFIASLCLTSVWEIRTYWLLV